MRLHLIDGRGYVIFFWLLGAPGLLFCWGTWISHPSFWILYLNIIVPFRLDTKIFPPGLNPGTSVVILLFSCLTLQRTNKRITKSGTADAFLMNIQPEEVKLCRESEQEKQNKTSELSAIWILKAWSILPDACYLLASRSYYFCTQCCLCPFPACLYISTRQLLSVFYSRQR